MKLAETLDGLEDGRLVEELRLDEVWVLFIEGYVDGVVVTETETQQVHGLLKIGLGLVGYVKGYFWRMMRTRMRRPLHILLHHIHLRKWQLIHKVTLIQVVVLQQVHLVQLQSNLLQDIWMFNRLDVGDAADEFLDLERGVLEDLDFGFDSDVVDFWKGGLGFEEWNVHVEDCVDVAVV